MYHHIRGRLTESGPMIVVVDVGGVGYELRVPLSTLEALRGQDEVLLYTHLHVREDDLRLFGFATREERRLFAQILGVSGVGPGIALAALSNLTVEELSAALVAGDSKTLRRIKGVGTRLADRLCLELRDRVSALESRVATAAAAGGAGGGSAAALADDARTALAALGFTAKETESRLESACQRLAECGDASPTLEAILREALR